MHTYIQRQNQQVNRRHIKITYLLTAPEPHGALSHTNTIVHQTSKRCSICHMGSHWHWYPITQWSQTWQHTASTFCQAHSYLPSYRASLHFYMEKYVLLLQQQWQAAQASKPAAEYTSGPVGGYSERLWVSSFLTAHQHNIGHSVPWKGG